MSYVQRPCVCGGTTFQVLPDVQLHYGTTGRGALTWMVIAVVCTQCTRTELFTSNSDQIASHIPNARMIAAGQP
jgi:hypothetical protein